MSEKLRWSEKQKANIPVGDELLNDVLPKLIEESKKKEIHLEALWLKSLEMMLERVYGALSDDINRDC